MAAPVTPADRRPWAPAHGWRRWHARHDELSTSFSISASNSAGRPDRVVPLEGYEAREGRICRHHRTTATIEGRQQEIYGTACRQPDGSWQRVS
jgi:surface antigen